MSGRLQVACNRLEQLQTGREVVLLPGDEVLEPTTKGVGLCVGAYFDDVGASGRILRCRIERHGRCLERDVRTLLTLALILCAVFMQSTLTAAAGRVVSETSLFREDSIPLARNAIAMFRL